MVERCPVKAYVVGSSPARGAMLTVAQLVEHLIVVQKVASSILVCQPKRPHRSVRPRTPPCHGENMGSNPIGAAILIIAGRIGIQTGLITLFQ